MRLEGKNVLITGATSGIGQALAARFAREGANVAVNYRSGADTARETMQMMYASCATTGRKGCRHIAVEGDV